MTKYKDTYPNELLELMKQGYLDCEVYSKWDVSKTQFYDWINPHKKDFKPELKEAHEIGRSYGEALIQGKLRDNALTGSDKGYKSLALLLATAHGIRYELEPKSQAITNNTQINLSVAPTNVSELVKKLQDNLNFLQSKNIPLIESDGNKHRESNE